MKRYPIDYVIFIIAILAILVTGIFVDNFIDIYLVFGIIAVSFVFLFSAIYQAYESLSNEIKLLKGVQNLDTLKLLQTTNALVEDTLKLVRDLAVSKSSQTLKDTKSSQTKTTSKTSESSKTTKTTKTSKSPKVTKSEIEEVKPKSKTKKA